MKRTALVILATMVLSGCASSLRIAEEKTRLAGAASPLGAVIWLPVWTASKIANALSGEPEVPQTFSAAQETAAREKERAESPFVR